MMNNLFVPTENGTATISKAALTYTAELTQVATNVAQEFMARAVTAPELDGDAAHADRLKQAMTDNNVLDDMLQEFTSIDYTSAMFLAEADEEELDRMLKSQQSKRSRMKKLPMTQANFTSMVTGAVAEILIRRVSGKSKAATTVVRLSGTELNEEQAAFFADNQDALIKAIRNVQSKKTGLKKKELEGSAEWNELLEFESKLKALRVGGRPTTTVVKTIEVLPEAVVQKIETLDAAKEVFAEVVDIDKMKAADAKDLLKRIQEMVNL